jgi:hypothetical protein
MDGREMRKGELNVMHDGRWVPLGEAEFLVEDGKIVKFISFTPTEITSDGTNAVE